MSRPLKAYPVTPLVFKRLNRVMVALWRLGLGPLVNATPAQTGRIMVLTTTGRKSGLPRRTPVNYYPVNGVVYCAAGFGHTSDWYRNLAAHPALEVWLPDGRWAAHAETVTDVDSAAPVMGQLLRNTGFAAKAFAGIDPAAVSETELRALAASWPVVRVHLERRLTGRGGPGDLAWLWAVAAALGALAWLWRHNMREEQTG